jgi:FG-GAP-like repeat
MQYEPPQRRTRRRSAAALASATAIVAALAAPAAAHAAAPAPVPAAAAPAAAPRSAAAQVRQAAADASATAAATGRAVPVTAATTAVSTTTAEPDGTFTEVVSSQPERTLRGGDWIPLDATLVRTPGGWSPAASAAGLTLSGGGTGPLATLRHDGKRLSVSWPTALPAPTVTGSTALYPEVRPGVDLRLTADDQGGFTEVLVVKSAAAAADPALRQLALPTTADGVTVSADAAGNLSATDPATGKVAFHAPAPVMWDSPAPAANAAARATARSAATSATPAGTDPADGPVAGSREARVAVGLSGGKLRLTPDQRLLTGAGVHYPVYIDPTWVSVTDTSSGSTYVQSAYSGTSHYSDTGNDLGVGYQGFSSPTGKERTYYQFSVGTSMGSHTINSALLNVTQSYSSDWSCTAYSITETNVAHIGTSTTWDNQPAAYTQTSTHSFTGSNNSGCAGDTKGSFNVTGSVSADGDGVVTYRLTGSESNENAFKRFDKKATLTIQYNIPPNAPSSTTSTPKPMNPATYGCSGAPYGWVGKNSGIGLSAHVSDPDGDKQDIRGQFAFWDKGGDGTATASNLISTGDADGESATVPGSGGTAHITVSPTDHPLKDGHLYGWHVRTDDLIDQSAESPNCYFWYDATAPTGLTATTPDFPADGSTTKHAGDSATFTFGAADPVPSGASASGLDHFAYSLASSADLAGDGGTHVAAGAGGTATVQPVLTAWGSTTLFVAAVDKAGNQSATVALTFYVPEVLHGSVHPGDIDNDGKPDLVAADSASGNLYLAPTDQELPATGPVVAGLPADAPAAADGSTTWAGTLVAHRSGSTRSTSGNWVDDLWAFKNGHLWLYANNVNTDGGLAGNDGHYFTRAHRVATTRPACVTGDCTGYTADWSAVTQLIAPGDVDGDGYPDVITVESDMLWLFRGTSTTGALTDPRKIGTSAWNGYTVIASGDSTGDGVPDIWARNNTSGDLFTYPAVVSGTSITLGARITIATVNFTATARPLIASVGDADGDGLPDLFTVHGGDDRLWANMGMPRDANGNEVTAHDVVSTAPLWQTVTAIG